MPAAVSMERVLEAVEADDGLGFCTACGADVDGCEPDARGYTCPECGQRTVCGAAELLIAYGE
jgi:predicted RNA-binding Zn-ribbon protein involved in translation (DUF1610 family)